MSEMSDADVFSALQEAAAKEVAADAAEQAEATPEASSPSAPEEGAPVEEATEPEGQAPAQVEETGEVEQPIPEPEKPFNPDELPEDLVPAWRQMQAAFTPRLQKAAAITKKFEELGGEELVEQAVDFLHQVKDPENWPTLYEWLYEQMKTEGFEFEDPTSPAAPASPAPSSFGDAVDDPDLAPVIAELERLRSRTDDQQQLIDSFYAEQERNQRMAAEELAQTQHIANMQRQVMQIRQANPHYDTDDIKAIVELGSFYGDDLVTAQQRYEAIVSRRLDRYFSSKKTAPAPSTAPVAGAGVLSEQDKPLETIEDAEAEAIEYVRRLQAAGEFDS